MTLTDRVRGLVYGQAFGNALGAPVVKLSAAQIARRFGRVNTLDMPWHMENDPVSARRGRVRGHGIFTDETLMMLCLMALYRETGRHLDAWDMAGGMVRQIAWTARWIPEMQCETTLLERLSLPEKWIFIRHQLAGCEPREGGIGNMVNCGAATYIAPVGAVNTADPQAAYDEAIAFASGHQSSYGLEAAGVTAASVAAALAPEARIEGVVEAALAVAKDGTRQAIADVATAARARRGQSFEAVTAEFHRILARYSSMGDAVDPRREAAGQPTEDYRPSRLRSVEELPMALGYALLHEGEFRPAVEDAVNSGRDTDSLGGIAGAILGAMHGEAVLREAERAQLDTANRADLADDADAFTAVATAILLADAHRAVRVATARTALGM